MGKTTTLPPEPITLLAPALQELLGVKGRWHKVEGRHVFQQTLLPESGISARYFSYRDFDQIDPRLTHTANRLLDVGVSVTSDMIALNLACCDHARVFDVSSEGTERRYFLHRFLSIDNDPHYDEFAYVRFLHYEGLAGAAFHFANKTEKTQVLVQELQMNHGAVLWTEMDALFSAGKEQAQRMLSIGLSPAEVAHHLEQPRVHDADVAISIPFSLDVL